MSYLLQNVVNSVAQSCVFLLGSFLWKCYFYANVLKGGTTSCPKQTNKQTNKETNKQAKQIETITATGQHEIDRHVIAQIAPGNEQTRGRSDFSRRHSLISSLV